MPGIYKIHPQPSMNISVFYGISCEGNYPKKCSCIFWQPQYFVKYCVKTVCPNTHIRKKVCCVLSSRVFLFFYQNLSLYPKWFYRKNPLDIPPPPEFYKPL